jgi:hypothetical protein
MVTFSSISPQNSRTGTSASTDAAGAFSFEGLAEGHYLFNAMHPSYPRGSSQKQIELKSAEKASINIELTPGAIISGTIFDETGDPLAACYAQAAPASRPNQPQQSAPANPDGEYRIHGLAPGKYVVSARCTSNPFVPRPFSAGLDPPSSLAYAPQYYPAANDAKSAQAVDLAPGVEKPGVDFRMRPTPATQVHGTVTSSLPDGNMNVTLFPVAGPQSESQGSAVDRQKGTFEFRRVFPGSYYLVAISNTEVRISAFERIEVKDRPVEVAMTLSPAVDLAGSVTIEDDNSTDKTPLNQIQIRLQPEMPAGQGVEQVQPKDDGSFVIKAVSANRWRVMVYADRLYMKSAWLGSTDVTGSAFEVGTGSESLRIVMSGNLGTIAGTAPAGWLVYAANEGDYQRLPVVVVDQTGRFSLPRVPPGKYRVGIMDPGSPIPAEGGQNITVKEGETVTIDVKQP